ncbi:hypothetical protein [Zavarzinella formosa]|uniref:hypothetical protein n=1 Tax=Zavarzinella formosa TaxID=360055 RepID=UPI0002EFA928|nr:hypothetical protein [Zavarzinella formosa]
MRRSQMAAGIVLAGLLGLAAGCSPPVKTETIEVKPADPLAQVKTTLANYVKGQPLGSEVTAFPTMVETVKKANPEKGALVEKGFADLQKPGANTKAIAKDLLAKLQ